MKRKVGFWRWLLHYAKDSPKTLIEILKEIVREPFWEMMLSGGICFMGVLLMPIWFDVCNIPLSILSSLSYLGILFGFALLLMLHGIYRDSVK